MGSSAMHSNIKNRSRLAPSFLEHVPVEMLGTQAHTQLLPMSVLNPESKMLDAAYIGEEGTDYSITVLRTAFKLL